MLYKFKNTSNLLLKLILQLAGLVIALSATSSLAEIAIGPNTSQPISIKPIQSSNQIQQASVLKPLELTTGGLELHGFGKVKEVTTQGLELHGFALSTKEVNVPTTLELHGKSVSTVAKEITTSVIELHGFSNKVLNVNVPLTLELHGVKSIINSNAEKKRVGLPELPSIQSNVVKPSLANVAARSATLPDSKPIETDVFRKNNPNNSQTMASAANAMPSIVAQNKKLEAVAEPAIQSGFDKVAYKRDANMRLVNIWLNKCTSSECKLQMQKIIDTRIAEILDKSGKDVDLRNPALLTNLESQMDVKYNPLMQQVLDKTQFKIQVFKTPVQINPINAKRLIKPTNN